MNFRTKIWMLPLSAATVFVIGVAVSVVLGARLSDGLKQLREHDEPHYTQLSRVERAAEQVEQSVQAAVSEGEPDKLKDVVKIAAAGRQAVAEIGKLPGKEDSAKTLGAAFDAYQFAAVAAVEKLLGKGDGDKSKLVATMQAAQTALKKTMAEQKDSARTLMDTRFDAAASGVRNSLIVTLATGGIVLLTLGIASWFIIASVWRQLGNEPDRLRDAVGRIANGELELDMDASDGDTHSLNAALVGMTSKLRTMIHDIRHATDSISTASNEIATGNQDLSGRTEQTASRLQQASSSMEQLTGTVRQTSESARTANQLASSASNAAERGGQVVGGVVSNMQEIASASRKITEIIATIDGIAFQTNILALNAAVEAARAGEQGRGFAVVAAEVRNLAHRSGDAAKEIKTLIGASTEKVESGTKLVEEAGNSMQEIVASVQRVNDIIGEISAATAEQTAGIVEVNETVGHLDQMTQQNAALVEQSAAAAESLREQAHALTETVGRFRG